MPSVKKIPATDFYGTFEGIVEIKNIEFLTIKSDGQEIEEAKVNVRWNQNVLFIFEQNVMMLKKLKSLKIGDVIYIKSKFENKWYPKAKPLANLSKIFELQKLGVK
jgi:hypothetical protein